jgi:hypothetical protein
MQLAAAIALTVFYVGLTLAWGGLHPGRGVPWWVFAPFIVTLCAVMLSWAVSAALPPPWAEGRRYGSPPRRVHLSWRTALRIPAPLPMLVFLYYGYWALSRHFEVGWAVYAVVGLAAGATALAMRRQRREVRLLRNGAMAMGVIDAREDIGGGPDRVAFHFATAGGATVSGRGWDVGYGVVAGSHVPVFYDTGDPGDHVLACSSWFEVD